MRLLTGKTSRDSDPKVLLIVLVGMLFYAAIPASILNRRSSAPLFSAAGLRANPVLLLPCFTCLAMAGFRYLFERGSRVDSVGPQYAPPKDLSAIQAGVFVDGSVEPRDVIAGIVDLGARGYLRIEPLAADDPGAPATDYAFHNLHRPYWGSELPPYDAALMQHIFQFGERPLLSELKHGLADFLPVLRDKVFASLTEKQLYRTDPLFGQALVILCGGGALALLFGVAQWFNLALADSPVIYALSFVLSGGVVYFFSHRVSWRSAAGNRALRELLGFKEFLQRVMADRLRALPMEQVEAMVPYAIAFGVERAWAHTFKDIVTKPLSWFLPPADDDETSLRSFDSETNARFLIHMADLLEPGQMQNEAQAMRKAATRR